MSSKIEVSRELLGQLAAYASDSASAVMRARAVEVRKLLAAPVVERQPVVEQYRVVRHDPRDQKYSSWFEIEDGAKREQIAISLRFTASRGEPAAYETRSLYTDPPELAELQATIARLTAESGRLQRSNDDLSASVKYWFNAKKQDHEQTVIGLLQSGSGDETPYQPKGDWWFERLEGGEIVIRNGRDWTVIKSGDGPAYEQFLYRFCEHQMKSCPLALPDPHGKQSNLKDTQYAMGWNACLDKVKELNQSQPAHYTAVDMTTAAAQGFKDGQAAQFAVVMPERKNITLTGSMNDLRETDRRHGYNAALDEVARLNTPQ